MIFISPITCPKCRAVFEPVEVNKRFRTATTSKPKSDFEPVVAEAPEAVFISRERIARPPSRA
jgi:hypothetical protein